MHKWLLAGVAAVALGFVAMSPVQAAPPWPVAPVAAVQCRPVAPVWHRGHRAHFHRAVGPVAHHWKYHRAHGHRR
jgi:hypothetical protein